MKLFLTLLGAFTIQLCCANMSSPIIEGTSASDVLSSRDIDILKEKLSITIDKNFKTASYVIEYTIKTDSAGKQIPLLFYAVDYKSFFVVTVDGKETQLLDIPREYTTIASTPFEKFGNCFTQSENKDTPRDYVNIRWNEYQTDNCKLSDLKYFEVDLSKGEHTIRVEYTAGAWTNTGGWIKKYDFYYSLSPAKNWRTFGALEITIDNTASGKSITTNLGKPLNGSLEKTASWKFNNVPADYLQISYQQKMTALTSRLIDISPLGLTIVMSLLLAFFHIMGIRHYRKTDPEGRSHILIIGNIFNPFLILIFSIGSYSIIDWSIGPEAGGRHGYTFLVILLYPIVLLFYALVMWGIDESLRQKTDDPA